MAGADACIALSVRDVPADVLLVHPDRRMLYRAVLPVSLPSLIHRIHVPVRGWYASTVPVESVRRARIVLIDIHWHVHLGPGIEIARKVRQVNPGAVVVAGGLTASMFAQILVEGGLFDYVVRGDGEVPVPALVRRLLDDPARLDEVPNLVGRDGLETPWSYKITQADLDENDYLDLGFFPEVLRDTRRLHANNPTWPVSVFPWLMPFRGCPLQCDHCVGGIGTQRRLFHRTFVVRSAERVADDLERLDRDPHIRFVNSFLDFLTLTSPEDVDRILRRPLRLYVQHEFARAPRREVVDRMLGTFSGGVMTFCMDSHHGTSARFVDPAVLIPLVRQVQGRAGWVPMLAYSGDYVRSNPAYRRATLAVARETRCIPYDASIWWHGDIPLAAPNGGAAPESFESVRVPAFGHRYEGQRFFVRTAEMLGRVLPSSVHVSLRKLFYRAAFGTRLRLAGRRDTPEPEAIEVRSPVATRRVFD